MPRRELLTAAQRKALLAFPEEEENLLQYYGSAQETEIYVR
jgi:hypothetical protein